MSGPRASAAVVLRCDGDPRTGAGHVGRCLPIAEAFRRRGHAVRFVGRYAGTAAAMLDDAQFPTVVSGDGPAGLPDDTDIAVVDSYVIPRAEIAAAAEGGRPVAAFADEQAEPVAPALTIDYHLAHGPSADLAGPAYVPVAPAFVAARRAQRAGPVLVTLGGSTQGTAALDPILSGLLRRDDVLVDLVGAVTTPPGVDGRVRPRGSLPGLAGALGAAGALVCGAGFTAYEAACAGAPALFVVLVDNQVRGGFGFRGLTPVLDARAGLETEDVATGLEELATSLLPARGPALVDGYGAARIRDALLARWAGDRVPRVLLHRPATMDDADLLLRWRNDPAVRGVSVTTQEIGRKDHVAWLRGVLDDDDRALLVCEEGGVPVATARLDHGDGEAEISITVDPQSRGAGRGQQVIREVTELALAARADVASVVATVGADNDASRRAFTAAGYTYERADDGWLRLRSVR